LKVKTRQKKTTRRKPHRKPPATRLLLIRHGEVEARYQRIFGGRIRGEESEEPRAADGAKRDAVSASAMSPLAQRAWDAWQKGQEALRRGDWAAYGQAQKQLEETLRQLRELR